MRYRAEIDGLRAIAVLAVLVYHAQFMVAGHSLLPGGFLGVDVFFVISGYLISSILLNAMDTGTFSFADFYARRARRILPMLFLVVACTVPAAVALMGLQALREYFLSAVASLWFGANFVFWLQDGYYAEPSELKPLLHTWSLAIEEQFYLLFPVLLLLAHRYCRGQLARLALALAVGSLLLAHYGSRHFADATFYLLPTRAWELLCGVLLALWEREARNTAIQQAAAGRYLASALAALGLVLVALSFCIFTSHARHPSLWTLLPVAGSMLLIRYGGGTHPVARLLQMPALVFVGLVSYGLYLWHFPLLVFARHVYQAPPPLVNLALLVAAFALAVLSYRWFEKPLRFSTSLGIGRFLRGAVATCGVLSVGLALGYAQVGERLGRYVIAGVSYDVAAEMQKRFEPLREDCTALGWDRCAEPLDDRVNILIVGDSLVDDAYNVFRALYPDYHFVRNMLGGCPPHPDIVALIDFELPDLQQCLALNKERFTPEALAGFDGVVIDNHYEWFTPQDLEPYLAFLGEQGMSNVLLLGNYLGLAANLPDLYRDTTLELSYAGLRDAGRLAIDFDYEPALAALAEHHGVEYLDLRAALCADGDCPLLVGAYPFTWDKFHFSLEFSQFLAQRLQSRLQASWLDAVAHRHTAQGDF